MHKIERPFIFQKLFVYTIVELAGNAQETSPDLFRCFLFPLFLCCHCNRYSPENPSFFLLKHEFNTCRVIEGRYGCCTMSAAYSSPLNCDEMHFTQLSSGVQIQVLSMTHFVYGVTLLPLPRVGVTSS